MLSRAETHSGALEWFNIPIVDLTDWVKEIERANKSSETHRKK